MRNFHRNPEEGGQYYSFTFDNFKRKKPERSNSPVLSFKMLRSNKMGRHVNKLKMKYMRTVVEV